MARDFDQASDWLDLGSDASIDNLVPRSVLMWIHADDSAAGAAQALAVKGSWIELTDSAAAGWVFMWRTSLTSDGHLRFSHGWSLVDGAWVTPDDGVSNVAAHAVGFAYNKGSTANDPNIYIDGALIAEAEALTPSGAADSDAAVGMRVGDDSSELRGFDGRMGWLVMTDSALTAADANRHRWHGMAPGGPSTMEVWHPLVTDSLTNKGTATADATATGTTMASLPKVRRIKGGR